MASGTRKNAGTVISEILASRSGKTYPCDLDKIEAAMLTASNTALLQNGDTTITLPDLISDYHIRMDREYGLKSDRYARLTENGYRYRTEEAALVAARNHFIDVIVKDTNPIINGASKIALQKQKLTDCLKEHPLNSGKNNKEKESIACNWTDKIEEAIMATLKPELQAGLSKNTPQRKGRK